MNPPKYKSQRNVCRIDLNDGSDKQRQSSNNSTVNTKPSASSPMNQSSGPKNYSTFQNLMAQLQPSISKTPKGYSQHKQLLISKKNEIIKTALKNSLNLKKPGTPLKTDARETQPVKPYNKYEKENELPSDARIKTREKMDQFYSNMKFARTQSTSKQQHNLDRPNCITSFVSPKNRSFIQKAVIPNATNRSGTPNALEPRTTNTTMIRYTTDARDNSTKKDRGKSFDYKQDSVGNPGKLQLQNRILLELDESMNIGPVDTMKGSNTTAHARYSQSREEIRNMLTPNNYQQSRNRSGSTTRPSVIDAPCKIVRDLEKPFQNPKESSPDQDIFEIDGMSPIKSNTNKDGGSNIPEGFDRSQKNLANQPYPTIIKQINLNSNTPTSMGRPPRYNFAQQMEEATNAMVAQESDKRFVQDYVKQKSLNIQTVKENKKIEFPGYLQNLTYDRSKQNKNIGFGDQPRAETPTERAFRAPLQPATLNFIENLKKNRLASEFSREYGVNKTTIGTTVDHSRYNEGNNPNEQSGISHASPNRFVYDDTHRRTDVSNRSTKTPKDGSFVESYAKQLLETSGVTSNATTGRPKPELAIKKVNDILSGNENLMPSSVKGTLLNHEKFLKEAGELLHKRDKTPQGHIQTPPVLFTNNNIKNQAQEEKEQKEQAAKKAAAVLTPMEGTILGLDPSEKEYKMKKFKEDYIVGKQIGQGAYATVRIGVHKPTNTKVAIKIYEKVKIMDPMRSRSVKREIKLMQRIDNPNIIKIYDVVETNNHMNIIMEYMGGTSLHGFLKAQPNRRLKEEHAFSIFKQVTAGLYYCHTRCIAHRDIKLENILLDNYGNLKIIDFGFSTCIPNDKKVRMFCGTPSYMAPEIVTKIEYTGPPADIWALGVLLFALLCGTFPFKGMDDKDLYSKIAKGEFVVPEFVSDHAASLIKKMMTVDPEKRPSAKDVMSEPWYVMHAFLDKKPDRRTSSRSSSCLERKRTDKVDSSKPGFPNNLNIVAPTTEQPYLQMTTTNFVKSPNYDTPSEAYGRVDTRIPRGRDEDQPREATRHLSLSRNMGRQTPTSQTNNFYGDNKNMIYNIRNSSNKDVTDADVFEENYDDNKLSYKKTLTEMEVWNIPPNLSSEKSFTPQYGRGSHMGFHNRSFGKVGENTMQYDAESINNLMKMGYKEEEINQSLKDKSGAIFYIYNRMINEKKALHNSNYGDSITSDQNNNNSFNLSSHMALKRKSFNMGFNKAPLPSGYEKENMYGGIPRIGSTKEFAGTGNVDDVLKPLSGNFTGKNVLDEINIS